MTTTGQHPALNILNIRVRACLYLAAVVGNPVMVYLLDRDIVGVPEVTLFAGLSVLAGGTALANLREDAAPHVPVAEG